MSREVSISLQYNSQFIHYYHSNTALFHILLS